jgi:adiponectin receptor
MTNIIVVVAGVFIALGLSGVIPAMHYVITDGFYDAIYNAALGWLVLMAVLYIVGAVIYAARIPERIWPGRFDIWVRHLTRILHACMCYRYS